MRRAVLALAVVACVKPSPPFRPVPPAEDDPPVKEALERMHAARPRELRPVVVGVTEAPAHLFAWDLAGKLLWSQPAKVRSVPHVAGDVVVSEEGEGEVVVRDLRTGKVQVSLGDPALRLIGGDGEGGVSVITLSTQAGVDAYGSVIAIADGKVIWEHAVGFQVGVPAVRGGLVFVPWATRTLSILDLRSGDSLVRVSNADDVIGHALVDRGSIYLGHNRIYRLTPRWAAGRQPRIGSLEPVARPLPGQPPLFGDAYAPPPPIDSAAHRLRLVWRPRTEKGHVRLEGDNLYFLFYRYVFAFDPHGPGLKWVYAHPVDLVGASAQPRGLLVMDQGGSFGFVDAVTGQRTWEVATGLAPQVVRFRAEDLSPGRAPDGPGAPVHDRLLTLARDPDARLVGARTLAVELLASFDRPEVTEQAIGLCEQHDAPAPVHAAACELLATRTRGDGAVFGALAHTPAGPPPPISPLARAAVKMNLRTAVPLLLSWLEDPRTPEADLPDLLAALAVLGDRDVAEPVEAFLRLYHAEPYSDPLARALEKAIGIVATHRGPATKATLERIFADPMSMRGLASRASEALVLLPAGRKGRAATRDALFPAAARSEVPKQLSPGMTARALRGVRAELAACLRTDAGHAASAHLTIEVAPDGNPASVTVAPAGLAACMEPIVKRQRWPRTQASGPQRVSYVVSAEPEGE